MVSWCYMLGGLAYIIAGQLCNKITSSYLWELYDRIMDAHNDKRYADMIWYKIPVVDTKVNRFLVDVVFVAFWPVICIAAILKAEWNYDKVMRRNVFKKNAL